MTGSLYTHNPCTAELSIAMETITFKEQNAIDIKPFRRHLKLVMHLKYKEISLLINTLFPAIVISFFNGESGICCFAFPSNAPSNKHT